jgi:hypothetical protein
MLSQDASTYNDAPSADMKKDNTEKHPPGGAQNDTKTNQVTEKPAEKPPVTVGADKTDNKASHDKPTPMHNPTAPKFTISDNPAHNPGQSSRHGRKVPPDIAWLVDGLC